ncbi:MULTISPECIES: hypothetical protein [Blastomonas]|nr:hypothetical protein [Blastomonas sp. RAC04]
MTLHIFAIMLLRPCQRPSLRLVLARIFRGPGMKRINRDVSSA